MMRLAQIFVALVMCIAVPVLLLMAGIDKLQGKNIGPVIRKEDLATDQWPQ